MITELTRPNASAPDLSDAPKKVYIKTFGCQMNAYDAERMAEALVGQGYEETANIAEAELVIVVGSANSSNTVRLVDVALESGAHSAYRVDYASEIRQEWLDGVSTVGVTSGASVPEVLVQEVLDDLADALRAVFVRDVSRVAGVQVGVDERDRPDGRRQLERRPALAAVVVDERGR